MKLLNPKTKSDMDYKYGVFISYPSKDYEPKQTQMRVFFPVVIMGTGF